MRFAPFAALLVFALSPLVAVSRIHAQTMPATPLPPAQTQSAPQSPPAPAYTLPPDKLAKAKVLNEIRLILEIGGDLWGLVVIWLLLATGSAAALEAWAMRIAHRRWIQGIVYFAAFFVITTL